MSGKSDMSTFLMCVFSVVAMNWEMIGPLIKSLFAKTFRFKESKLISFSAKLTMQQWSNQPDSLVRIFSVNLWEWVRTNSVVGVKTFQETAIRDHYDENQVGGDKKQPFFIDDETNEFWHVERPNIRYLMWIDKHTDRDGIPRYELNLTIRFYDTSVTPTNITAHLEWLKDEAERYTKIRNCKQRIIMTTGEENDDKKLVFSTFEFMTTTRFDNFFSEESQLVLADLKHFLHDKASYSRIGRPWTYSILNTGPPGVGKTKLVKAIAQYTGYTLIILHLQHINSITQLCDAFHASVLAGDHVPHIKRLYYIPEIDTQVNQVLGARPSSGSGFSGFSGSLVAQPTNIMDQKDTKDVAKKPDVSIQSYGTQPKITLGDILNVLDGVPERHGHILVFDTNHLERLDPALIRPGRVDRIIRWDSMSATSLRAYLGNYYQCVVPADKKLPDCKFTAAEVGQITMAHKTLAGCLRVLSKK